MAIPDRRPAATPANEAARALVVFHGFGHGLLTRLFGCAGFRHCFVCIAHHGSWLRLDFQDGVPALEVVCADSFDLAAFYRAAGLTVIRTERRNRRPRWPVMLATCVGAVKKVLGADAPFALTPHQLYRHLCKEQDHG